MHRLDLGLYFHPKEVLENGVRTHVNSKEKFSSEGDRSHDAASSRTAGPAHSQRATPAHCSDMKAGCRDLLLINLSGFSLTRPCSMSDPGLSFTLPFRVIWIRQSNRGARPRRDVGEWSRVCVSVLFVGCWLLNVPATCACISGADLLPH